MTDAFAIMSGLLFAACHGSNDGKDRDRALMGYVFEDMYDILAASVLAMIRMRRCLAWPDIMRSGPLAAGADD